MGLMVTALSVARERELGTFEQLLVSPLGPREIIIGKTVPALLIGIARGDRHDAGRRVVFRVPFQARCCCCTSSMVVYLFAVIGVGLFVSSLAKTQQQAILGAFVFMVPAMLLSGFASPIENMPDWLQTVTLANPIRYFMVIVKGIFLKDMPAAIVFQNLWPMAVIGTATFSCRQLAVPPSRRQLALTKGGRPSMPLCRSASFSVWAKCRRALGAPQSAKFD